MVLQTDRFICRYVPLYRGLSQSSGVADEPFIAVGGAAAVLDDAYSASRLAAKSEAIDIGSTRWCAGTDRAPATRRILAQSCCAERERSNARYR